MKLVNRVSPSIKCGRTTVQIMNELTLGLVVLVLFSAYFYGVNYGSKHLIHMGLLFLVSLVVGLVVEAIWAKIMKKDIVAFWKTSFPWVTSLILVMCCSVQVSLYAMAIATIFAILIGKLLFGGFGQNIFNPAGVGRAVIGLAFAASINPDVVSGATPMGLMGQQGWQLAAGSSQAFFDQFGGLWSFLAGWRPGAIGETSTLLILVVGIILAIRKVIDWRIPFFYLGNILLLSTVVTLVCGMDPFFPLVVVSSGGIMFAAFFMLTDPVTSPTNPMGRVIFGLGAGFLTFLLRFMAHAGSDVVFSILLINMLAPMIDMLLMGNQLKTLKKGWMILCSVLVLSLAVVTGYALSVGKVEKASDTVFVTDQKDGPDGTVFTISSVGLHKEKPNLLEVTIKDGKVVNVQFIEVNDTPEFAKPVTEPAYLDQYKGRSDNQVDGYSGATFTSTSVSEAVGLALKEANK